MLIGLAAIAALLLTTLVPLVLGTGAGPDFNHPRAIVSDAVTGADPAISNPQAIDVEASGDIVLMDGDLDAVVRVDPVTGDRTIVSGAGTGSGPGIFSTTGIYLALAIEASGDFVVLHNYSVVLRIDPVTGDRAIVSDNNMSAGPIFRRGRAIAVEPSGTLVVVDTSYDAVLRVDPVTGDRTIFSGSGPTMPFPRGIAVEASADLVVTDTSTNAVFRIDSVTGNRVNLSDLPKLPTPTPCPTGCPTATPTATPEFKTLIHLEIAGDFGGVAVSCDSRTQSTCKLENGSSFTLDLVPSIIPPAGYTSWQTLVDYGGLLYKPSDDEETWALSLKPVRLPQYPSGKEDQVVHGDLSAFFPPMPISFQTTSLLTLQFNCADNGQPAGQPFSQLLQLIDYNASPSGTLFSNGDFEIFVPNSSSLTIECNPPPTKQPDPADTDGDGCSDQAENGEFEYLGGQRDLLYFWDFYDVWTHPPGDPSGWERNKVLNIFDMIAVGARFGPGPLLSKADALAQALVPPTDATSYHPAYDRGPIIGANMWDRGPPDGSINIVDDILGIAQQFGHSCA